MSAMAKARFKEAIEHLQGALASWEEADYLRGIAAAHGRLGTSLSYLKRSQEAVGHLDQAIVLWGQAGDLQGVAGNLITLANTEADLHHWDEALDAAKRARQIAEDASLELSAAYALSSICGTHYRKGNVEEALDWCHKAAARWQELGQPVRSISPLGTIAAIHRLTGELGRATTDYEEILRILAEHPDPNLEAEIHNNLGTLFFSLGQYQKALVEYQEALAMCKDQDNTARIAGKYYSIGTVYLKMGDLNHALGYYQEARELQEGYDAVHELVYTLVGLGGIHVLQGDVDQAIEPMKRALEISRRSGAKSLLALALRRMATLKLAQGRPAEALAATREGLPLAREARDRWEEIALLDRKASAQEDLDSQKEALETLLEAKRIAEEIGDHRDLARTEYRMAQIHREQGDLETARRLMEHVLEVADQTRGQIQVQEIRSLIGATQQEYHGFYIDLLMQLQAEDATANFDRLAFEATEQARAKSLLEVLSSAQLDTEKLVPDSLRSERKTLRMQVAATEQRRTELLDKSGDGTDSTDLFDLEVEIDRLMTELGEVEQKIRAASPTYAELTRPEVVTVDEVQRSLLDPDTALLEFRLGEDRSFLFLITPDAFQTFELPARGVLEEDARCIHWLLTSFTDSDTGTDGDETRATCLGPGQAALEEDRSQNPFEARARHRRLVEQAFAERAAMLSDHLFREAFDSGLLDGRRLAVVTDGALEYVPFAALPEPGTTRPLVVASRAGDACRRPRCWRSSATKTGPKPTPTTPSP